MKQNFVHLWKLLGIQNFIKDWLLILILKKNWLQKKITMKSFNKKMRNLSKLQKIYNLTLFYQEIIFPFVVFFLTKLLKHIKEKKKKNQYILFMVIYPQLTASILLCKNIYSSISQLDLDYLLEKVKTPLKCNFQTSFTQ